MSEGLSWLIPSLKENWLPAMMKDAHYYLYKQGGKLSDGRSSDAEELIIQDITKIVKEDYPSGIFDEDLEDEVDNYLSELKEKCLSKLRVDLRKYIYK